MSQEDQFIRDNGIYVPHDRPRHRDDEYDEHGFDMLVRMQRHHFWYRGRHRLLLNVLRKEMSRHMAGAGGLGAIDLGGGCGGWLEYLHAQDAALFRRLALGDSSLKALTLAEQSVGSFADRFQVDLLAVPWRNEWDVVFLLDVLEHLPDHVEVMRQAAGSMRPGGLLFVTTPALELFWTYNDEMAKHQRRYCREDFRELASQSGLELVRTDYFMFFLSPILLLNRLLFRPPASATPEQVREHAWRSHRIPSRPVNGLLSGIFALEGALVNAIRFPWGTSILAVFRKPTENPL
ncbi:MAG: class I SAM-dependent methyltransferase [Kiritimatiellia bacterium]